MKTFTVTYHHSTNYGALLQAFALQHTVVTLGHENVIFEYPERSGIYIKPSTESVYDFLRTVYINYLTLLRRKQIKRLSASFKRFKKTNMILSRVYVSMQDLKENPPDTDCLIVGSDQVWNLNTNPEFIPARFLDFGESELLRFSYAASIERMNYTESEKENIREKLFSPLIGLEKILSSAIIQIRGKPHDKKKLYSRIQRTDITGMPRGRKCCCCRQAA